MENKECPFCKNNIEKSVIPNLMTIIDFVKKHNFLTEGAIRWMLWKDVPGLEDCLVRTGSKILINEQLFFDFLIKNSKKIKDEKNKKKDMKVLKNES